MDGRDEDRLDDLLKASRWLIREAPEPESASAWYDEAMIWQDELIGLTGRVDPEFCALLRPLNERFVLAFEEIKDRQHRFNVSAIATQVAMLEKWIKEHTNGEGKEAGKD